MVRPKKRATRTRSLKHTTTTRGLSTKKVSSSNLVCSEFGLGDLWFWEFGKPAGRCRTEQFGDDVRNQSPVPYKFRCNKRQGRHNQERPKQKNYGSWDLSRQAYDIDIERKAKVFNKKITNQIQKTSDAESSHFREINKLATHIDTREQSYHEFMKARIDKI